jgi:gluconolactonase
MKRNLLSSIQYHVSTAAFLASTICLGIPQVDGAGPDVAAPGATVKQLADGFVFTEGPACDGAGNVYFTDQPNDRIMKWSSDGKLSTFMRPCGRSNGLYFDKAGNLWACADEKNQLWCIGADGTSKVVVKGFEGKLLNGPNDLWIRPDGGIYFTDPLYPRKYWNRGPSEQSCQGVYFVTPDRKKVVRVLDDLKTPNGLIGTPDGTVLYVADLKAGKTYAYDIQKDGALKGKRLFCELGSDGMTIDNEGNVYLTGKGVTVFNTKGEQIKHIPVDARWTANVCFGGKDRKTLFITASQYVFGLQMRVHGVNSHTLE